MSSKTYDTDTDITTEYSQSFQDLLDKSKPVSREYVEHLQSLVKGVEADLDEPLEGDDAEDESLFRDFIGLGKENERLQSELKRAQESFWAEKAQLFKELEAERGKVRELRNELEQARAQLLEYSREAPNSTTTPKQGR